MNGSIYVSDSGNTKIMGTKKVDATYASIKLSCPNSCSLKGGNGCYAETSFVGMVVNRLNSEAVGSSALDIARAEAKAIDKSYNGGNVPVGRAMRLHVAGDSRTLAGSRLINNAIGRWKKRGGGDCWSYTHAWSNIQRDVWSNVSMLASVANVTEATQAHNKGYAPAIVVDEHKTDKSYKLDGSDVKWIPCPAQTREIGCSDCRICMRSDWLFETNRGVAFAAHGVKKDIIKNTLKF